MWNKSFLENVSKHPEWLESQEEPDLVVEIHVSGEMRKEELEVEVSEDEELPWN